MSVEARVRRGAMLLDRVRPGWWWNVVMDDLAMSSCDRCILGQVFGNYFWGVEVIAESIRPDPERRRFWGSDHGFTRSADEHFAAPSPGQAPEWEELARCWRAEVDSRSSTNLEVPRVG